MEQFLEDLESGEFHVRDRWQIELKSEFTPLASEVSEYMQEFYFFIPASLQINSLTYPKSQFYLDQTNLIRYKTPRFSFDELLDRTNLRSPMTRLRNGIVNTQAADCLQKNSEELKLLGNVVRSTLREEVKSLGALLIQERKTKVFKTFTQKTEKLCKDIQNLRVSYWEMQDNCLKQCNDVFFCRQFLYVDEFISNSILHYLAGLLDHVRSLEDGLQRADESICAILLQEKKVSNAYLQNEAGKENKSENGENVLYRNGLLNKFILNALLLSTDRMTFEQRYQNWIGGFAAGIAMLIFFTLFVWIGNIFVINSQPFILFTVIIYILKDRIKEIIKNYSYLQAFRWFPDFTTRILSPDEKFKLGVMKESFSFIDPQQLQPEIKTTRDREFHEVLETFQRPESILLYKRIVKINKSIDNETRLHGLNVIFRTNLHQFLRKASDPFEVYVALDSETLKLRSMRLPKVYHLDIILKNTLSVSGNNAVSEIKKLRVVVDKNGIRRIEQLRKASP